MKELSNLKKEKLILDLNLKLKSHSIHLKNKIPSIKMKIFNNITWI
jgi:hypothetical protein